MIGVGLIALGWLATAAGATPVASGARTSSADSTCTTVIVCWSGWNWTGWPAIAAIAQILAAAGTLAALFFLWRQVVVLRAGQKQEATDRASDYSTQAAIRQEELNRAVQERKDDFELSHTPYLSLAIVQPILQTHDADVLAAECHVNADGLGAAYDVKVQLLIKGDQELVVVDSKDASYLRPPDSKSVQLNWIFGKARQDTPAAIDFSFINMFGK